MKKRELTTFKLITGIISGILIIAICVYLIVEKLKNGDTTYWQELLLIALAIFFLTIIIKGAIIKKNN